MGRKKNIYSIGIIIIGVIILVGGCGFLEKRTNNSNKSTEGVDEQEIHTQGTSEQIVDEQEVYAYDKPIYINGERISEKDAVVTYNDMLYMSLELLNEKITSDFISYNNHCFTVRRKTVSSFQVIQVNQKQFLPIQELEPYIHINHDVQKSNGVLYIDTMVSGNINFENQMYYLDQDFVQSNPFQREPDGITEDGRGIWKEENYLWIEDDWGRVYKYVIDKEQICI